MGQFEAKLKECVFSPLIWVWIHTLKNSKPVPLESLILNNLCLHFKRKRKKVARVEWKVAKSLGHGVG